MSRTLPLTEFVPTRLASQELPAHLAEAVWRDYGNQILVEWPSPKTGGSWELTSQGWVGHLPLSEDFRLVLQPKVPLANLFGMLEYAYQLKGLQFLKGTIDCEGLQEFYELLAKVLALRVLDRERVGLYRAYVTRNERTSFVRGRLELTAALKRAWQPFVDCSFEEHTSDVEENQLIAWTLARILASGACTERTLPSVRKAYRALHGVTKTIPPTPVGGRRLYNRLCDDYEPLHALCRLFLEQSGPAHVVGNKKMIPFLIDMSRLFELFVAEWLKAHLPSHVGLQVQERVYVGSQRDLHFKIDAVIYDRQSGAVQYVLDTKYKNVSTPSVTDVQQIVAYAVSTGCRNALLVYPTVLSRPIDERVGEVRVRTGSFVLNEELDRAGQAFLDRLSLHPEPVGS